MVRGEYKRRKGGEEKKNPIATSDCGSKGQVSLPPFGVVV